MASTQRGRALVEGGSALPTAPAGTAGHSPPGGSACTWVLRAAVRTRVGQPVGRHELSGRHS